MYQLFPYWSHWKLPLILQLNLLCLDKGFEIRFYVIDRISEQATKKKRSADLQAFGDTHRRVRPILQHLKEQSDNRAE
jgi:hypothetical protein